MQSQSSSSRSKRSSSQNKTTYTLVIWIVVLVLASFYAGIIVGINQSNSQQEIDAIIERRVKAATETIRKRHDIANRKDENAKKGQTRFPKEMSRFAFGAARTTRQEFLEKFDGGFPDSLRDEVSDSEVLLLYNNHKAVPTIRREETIFDDGAGLPMLSVDDATKNCQNLHVVSTKASLGAPQCLAIVGQYQSFHIHQWMRIGAWGGANMRHPLRPVSRGQLSTGRDEEAVPSFVTTKRSWKFLSLYMKNYDQVVSEVRPILARVASANRSVIVMVANLGQVELLINFVCNAKSKNLDLSNILVFVTDRESYDIATGLGLAAYHDELNFSWVSTESAKIYGDRTFRDMMFVKVTAVHRVNSLEYDVLFQDLDVVWYQNPLSFFEDQKAPLAKFEVIFQDDGARSVRFTPFAANSGFYYVRYTRKTRYLFGALLYNTDLIASTGSHQHALIQLITEHSSLHGLRVKTISDPVLLSGYHFHRQPHVMKQVVSGTLDPPPLVMHMCWTHSKKDKVLFMQQMGVWSVNLQCEGYAIKTLLPQTVIQHCCSAEPRIICHYKDKPSIVNCNTSPAMDRAGKSFW